jgi:cytoplasmic iron level regulating protein YaaA (DUF328/UPF0246 family)
MKQIALIACASKKISTPDKARNIYISPLFKLSMKYAEQLEPDQIFILSALHGLLDPNKVIDPYNVTLNKFSSSEIRAWANNVLSDLGSVANLKKDHFIILAGTNYRKYLTPHLGSYEVPLEGKGIGKQLQYLKQETAD